MLAAALLFARCKFTSRVGFAAEALIGTGEKEVGVGISRVMEGSLFQVIDGEFQLALLEKDTAEFKVSARGVGFGGFLQEGGCFRQAALAEEKGS